MKNQISETPSSTTASHLNADRSQHSNPEELDPTQTSITELLEGYKRAGWHLVSIPGGSKAPIEKGWNFPESQDNQGGYTQDIERIHAHLEQGGNLGLATLPSRVAAFDIDDLPKCRRFFDDQGYGREFEDLLDDNSQLHIMSGRLGRDKILFTVADGFELHTLNKSSSYGFELRFQSSNGSTTQDVLPPSIHPETGKPYQWKGSIANLQPIPAWLEAVWVGLERGNSKKPGGPNRRDEEKEVPALHPINLAMLTHALKCIPSEDYDDWVKVGLALKHSLGEAGFPLWAEWSKSTKAGNFCLETCEAKWEQAFDGDVPNPVTVGSIFHLAEERGWSKKLFAEAQLSHALGVIGEKTQEEITSDEFLDLLVFISNHAPVVWEREVTPALAKVGLKSRVKYLLKARLREQAGHQTNRQAGNDRQVVLEEVEGSLPRIYLREIRMHEVLQATMGVLAKTKRYFKQGPAICTLINQRAGLEIFTFSQAAEIRPELLKHAIWMKSSLERGWYKSAPDSAYANELRALPDKSVLPDLKTIARQPFFREDMSICNQPGFDEKTGIYGDFDPNKFDIPVAPTKEDAINAAEELRRLYEESGLDTEYDDSAALALLLTSAVRPSLNLAPFFLLNAKDPGAGKKYLGDIACLFGSDDPPMPTVLKQDANEVAKAVFSVLLTGASVLSYDEVQTPDDGTLDLPKPLLTIATSDTYRDRILCTSQVACCSTRVLVMIMGNNLRPTQDCIRRLIQINFGGRDFEEGVKSYNRDPLAEVQKERERFAGLALTIIRAWVVAGKPKSSLPRLPSYGMWCQFVREPILWLGYPDPVHNTLQAAQHDDHALNLRDLYVAWYAQHGEKHLTAGQLLRGIAQPSDGDEEHPLYTAIRELVPHKGSEEIPQQLGYLLKGNVGVIRSGLVLRKEPRDGKSNTKAGNRFFVEKIGPAEAANADFFNEEVL